MCFSLFLCVKILFFTHSIPSSSSSVQFPIPDLIKIAGIVSLYP